ncbi:MAG: tyrosine-protein phosphatase [Xenococcaceae cyanobacterium]
MKQPKSLQKSWKRHLKLTGGLSLRDLGGYETADAKLIRWCSLLRGYNLHHLSPATQQAIIDYGVKTIIDLRALSDVKNERYVSIKSPEIRYFNLPLLGERNLPQLKNKKTAKKIMLEFAHFIFEERSPQIKQILEAMRPRVAVRRKGTRIKTAIATNQTAFLIYGASEQDRTGIIIALLLAIADVPIKDIARDYILSEKYASLLSPTTGKQTIEAEFTRRLLFSPEAIMQPFKYLADRYGSIAGYLQAIGINTVNIKRLQTILID